MTNTDAAQSNSDFLPGVNCWRAEHASRVAYLRNADAYYHELARSIRAARRSVRILGWDFDRRIRLVRGRPDDKVDPCTLGELLLGCVEAQPELEIRILVWDKAPIFANTLEDLDILKTVRLEHPRIHVTLDADHPTLSSHHQKIVVVDDCVAYSGGIDLTRARWDTAEHATEDERRIAPGEHPYRPYHDVQMLVDSDAAAALGELCRIRWSRANGESEQARESAAADAGDGSSDPWPQGLEPDARDVDVAISRTEPEWNGHEEVREIERLYHGQIAAARRHIFIEQQYFTDSGICDALCRRLGEKDGPEVLLIMPRDTTGLLARLTMESLLPERLRRLRDADRFGRFRAFYPDAPGIPSTQGESINVHTKLLIIDDEILRVGSANLNGKSMWMDTECDLSVNAHDDAALAESIAALRHSLIAELLACDPERVAQAERDGASWGEAIEKLCDPDKRTLRPLEPKAPRWWVTLVGWLPARTTTQSDFLAAAQERGDASQRKDNGTEPQNEDRRRRWPVLGAVAVLLILAAMWSWGPLANMADPDVLAGTIRSSTWAGPVLLGLYCVGVLLMAPVHLLHVVAGLALGLREGMLWAAIGTMVSAVLSYSVGALTGEDVLQRRFGSRVAGLSERAGRSGLRGALVLRLLPGLPFGLVNIAFGASPVKFSTYMYATALIMLPSLLAIAVFGERAQAAWRDPSVASVAILAATAVALLGGVWLFSRSLRRWSDDGRGPSKG